jgi:hypothetical protein
MHVFEVLTDPSILDSMSYQILYLKALETDLYNCEYGTQGNAHHKYEEKQTVEAREPLGVEY